MCEGKQTCTWYTSETLWLLRCFFHILFRSTSHAVFTWVPGACFLFNVTWRKKKYAEYLFRITGDNHPEVSLYTHLPGRHTATVFSLYLSLGFLWPIFAFPVHVCRDHHCPVTAAPPRTIPQSAGVAAERAHGKSFADRKDHQVCSEGNVVLPLLSSQAIVFHVFFLSRASESWYFAAQGITLPFKSCQNHWGAQGFTRGQAHLPCREREVMGWYCSSCALPTPSRFAAGCFLSSPASFTAALTVVR